MHSFVSTVSYFRVSALRTALAVLVASLSVTACEEQDESEVQPSADAQVASPDGGDALATMPVSSVSVHVVGLLGAGMVVRIGQDENYEVNADGTYTVQLATPVNDLLFEVLTQPSGPNQTCEVDQLDRGRYALTCKARRYRVSGTVEGLAGMGLVLKDQSGETLAISSSGGFQFAHELDTDDSFEVTAEGTVMSPRQTCAVSGGMGRVRDADVTDVKVTCATKSYYITTNVSGLTQPGLQIQVTDGSIIPVPKAGRFRYDIPFPDGFKYNLDVYRQPEGDHRCSVQDGHAQIDGADAEINIICDGLGGLRISEVGACPFSNSSCWIEIYNSGELTENLAFYKLRTSAISATKVLKDYTFTLPYVTIPPQSFLLIQAATATSLPDGNNVVHIADGAVVPWWNSSGFVELLDSDVTTDFLRFGSSTQEPITGGTWGGGSAPALPTGNGAYGSAITHIPKNVIISSAEAWLAHGFGTPGGNNDVTTDTDNDKDGIPDTAEVSGGTYAGVNVYAMGARLGQKDVFVEIDRMSSNDPAVVPRREALDKLVAVFARRGITMHFDVGDLFSASFDPRGHNLGGGNMVPFSNGVGLGAKGAGMADLYTIKAANMAAARRNMFYYQLFAWSQQADGSGGSSGIGELPGNDSIITLGGFGLKTTSAMQTNLVINYQAASIMHEIGHNFGLRHGGADQVNRKPNYVSVMNYLYSPLGLPTIGASEGDRYDIYERCSVFSVAQLTNSPGGDVNKFVVDYSDGLSGDMDENALIEREGLGRNNSVDVDYNCNGKVDPTYSRDLNADNKLGLLADNDDWASLSFVFRRTTAGFENGNGLTLLNTGVHSDVLTSDRHGRTDLPCGAFDKAWLVGTE